MKAEFEKLIKELEKRFEKNKEMHGSLSWDNIIQKVISYSAKQMESVLAMENTGGQIDIISFNDKPDQIYFVDCSPESPVGRRSLCYDEDALHGRKENKPKGSALGMAKQYGWEILSEAEYRQLQSVGNFDNKTSSWVQTPAAIRDLGGALFCDKRYRQVFTYHNGAESYYAARGFRAKLLL